MTAFSGINTGLVSNYTRVFHNYGAVTVIDVEQERTEGIRSGLRWNFNSVNIRGTTYHNCLGVI